MGSLSQPKYSSELLSLDAVQQGIPCYCDTARTLLPPPPGLSMHPPPVPVMVPMSPCFRTICTGRVHYANRLRPVAPLQRTSLLSLLPFAIPDSCFSLIWYLHTLVQ